MTNILYNKKGIAIPILLVITICISCYMISLAWSMAGSRSKFQQTLNYRKAYYIARSGVEHMKLKLKIMQKYDSETISALENASQSEKEMLNKAFAEDVIIPFATESHKGGDSYKVTEFCLKDSDPDSDKLNFMLDVEGINSGYKSSIKRLIQISR